MEKLVQQQEQPSKDFDLGYLHSLVNIGDICTKREGYLEVCL